MQYENNPANVFRDIVQKLNYHPQSIKVINRLKIRGKTLGQRSSPQKAHLQPLKDVCMQYKSNPANGFRDIVRKRNTDAQPHGQTWCARLPVYNPANTKRLGLKKILFVSDFRPTLSKHVRPKFILWISKINKNKINKFRDELPTVVKVTLKNVSKRRVGAKSVKKQKIVT